MLQLIIQLGWPAIVNFPLSGLHLELVATVTDKTIVHLGTQGNNTIIIMTILNQLSHCCLAGHELNEL